jgi:hypothetical protein
VTLALAVLLATALARLQFPSQCVNGACGVVKFVALSRRSRVCCTFLII